MENRREVTSRTKYSTPTLHSVWKYIYIQLFERNINDENKNIYSSYVCSIIIINNTISRKIAYNVCFSIYTQKLNGNVMMSARWSDYEGESAEICFVKM